MAIYDKPDMDPQENNADEVEHEESCSEKAMELLEDVQEKYPEEKDIIMQIEHIIADLKDVESKNEDSDDYEDKSADEMGDDMRKKGIIIGLKFK